MSEKTDWSTQPVRRRTYADSRSSGSWMPGLVLIVLGAAFLAQSYVGTALQNWWALFLLIPAFAALGAAYEDLRAGDQEAATGPLIGGLAFLALTVALLLDLPIGQLWPVALIVVGIALLVGRRSWT